jgi:hypothetical protein
MTLSPVSTRRRARGDRRSGEARAHKSAPVSSRWPVQRSLQNASASSSVSGRSQPSTILNWPRIAPRAARRWRRRDFVASGRLLDTLDCPCNWRREKDRDAPARRSRNGLCELPGSGTAECCREACAARRDVDVPHLQAKKRHAGDRRRTRMLAICGYGSASALNRSSCSHGASVSGTLKPRARS